jgi:hypothetical protein
MSAETEAAVQEAIRLHFLDEIPEARLLTDWFVIAGAVGEDLDGVMYLHIDPGAPLHTQYGLATMAVRRLERQVWEMDEATED